jgi:hypothetical protein
MCKHLYVYMRIYMYYLCMCVSVYVCLRVHQALSVAEVDAYRVERKRVKENLERDGGDGAGGRDDESEYKVCYGNLQSNLTIK